MESIWGMHQPTVLMRDTCCQSVQVSLLLACDKRKHVNVQPEGLNCMQWAGTHRVRIWNTQVMMTSTKTSFLGLNRTTSFSSSLTRHSTSVAARTYVPKAAHPSYVISNRLLQQGSSIKGSGQTIRAHAMLRAEDTNDRGTRDIVNIRAAPDASISQMMLPKRRVTSVSSLLLFEGSKMHPAWSHDLSCILQKTCKHALTKQYSFGLQGADQRLKHQQFTLTALPHEEDLQDEACGETCQQRCHRSNVVQPGMASADVWNVDDIPSCNGNCDYPEEVKDCSTQSKERYVI